MNQWVQIVLSVLPFVLARNPKTAPIADEVAAAVAGAERALGAKTGKEKLAHVVSVAKEAAQAVDELRGSADETAGAVSEIVSASIPLVNVIAKHAIPVPVVPVPPSL